jgi:hypothetical protein
VTTAAKVILDSLSPSGDRLTTMELEFHRFVLAEFNTHRSHSRNSASSRAIPVEKQLAKVVDSPAWPLVWACEQPGMQGGSSLTGKDLNDAQMLFHDLWEYTTQRIKRYLDEHPDKSTRLHKSLLNRPLEPFMWHRVIATATKDGWDNFFALRSTEFSPLAQPEIAACADLALQAYRESDPRPLGIGEWHTPYIRSDEDFSLEERCKVSVARCARVSYLTHDGIRDHKEDLAMYGRLTSADPMHASPLEHVATPAPTGIQIAGNFKGWDQLRHISLPEAA